MMLIFLLSCAALLRLAFTNEHVAATDSNGNKFRHLPIQWCAVAGSPTAVTPGTVDPDNPGADTNTVLWRRHERVSDRIYLAQPASDATNDIVPVTFRSAADQQTFPFLPNRSFPIITGPNANGDVDISNTQAVQALVQACQQAWGSSAPGIPVINVNHLSNAGSSLGGQGYYNWTCGGDVGTHTPWTVTSNFVLISDRMYSANGDQDANLLGHELGHALNMLHTDPSQNVMSRVVINSADPPHSFSNNIQDGVDQAIANFSCLTGTIPRTINQIDWHQQEAKKWPGTVLDPPDSLISALLPSFVLLDDLGDVPASENFVDLSAVRLTGDVPNGVMHLTFRLVGQIPQTSRIPIDYFFLADLDNNAATGGTPAQFPADSDLPTNSFTGVELIVRVRAQLTGSVEFPSFTLTPTVWLFQAGAFAEQAANFATAFIELNSAGGDHPTPATFGNIDVVFPLSVPTGSVRVQAITHDTNPQTNTIDKLDDTDAGVAGSLAPPQFASCGVNPGQVQPGVNTSVSARGLVPNASAKIMLADFLLRVATADANGNVNASIVIPSDSRTGRRLVTVGTLGTALTADCAVDVEGTPVVPMPVPVDIKPTSCPNPLNLNAQGTLPVAILGTSTLDVTQIDPASIRLAGVAPLRFTYQDVATPFSPFIGKSGANACTTLGPDGFTDLTMAFNATQIAAAIGPVTNGQVLTLQLTGNFLPQYGGAPIVGEDVVVIKTK
jgi:hypothetical protein